MNFEKWLEGLSDKELEEAMNVKYDYIDNTKGLIGRWSFISKSGRRYDVTGSKLSKDIFHAMFEYVDKEGNTMSSLTNFKDNPTAIMNSVYNIVETELIKKYHPKELRFEAEGDKRQKMYDVVIRRYILPKMKKYGYDLYTEKKEELPMKIYRFIKELKV